MNGGLCIYLTEASQSKSRVFESVLDKQREEEGANVDNPFSSAIYRESIVDKHLFGHRICVLP